MQPSEQLVLQERQFTPQLIEAPDTRVYTPSVIQPQTLEISRATKQTLDELFPEQEREEKEIQKAKSALGELASSFSHQELKEVIAEFQYLAESWLDDFEREIFEGATLQELLHEKGAR